MTMREMNLNLNEVIVQLVNVWKDENYFIEI